MRTTPSFQKISKKTRRAERGASMKLKKNVIAFSVIMTMSCGLISCSNNKQNQSTTKTDTQEQPGVQDETTGNEAESDSAGETSNIPDESSTESADTNWDEVYTVSDYTPNPSRMDALNLSSDLDKYDLTVDSGSGSYDSSFSVSLEAEDAVLAGNVKVESEVEGYTGSGYINGIERAGDTVTFQFEVPGDGTYDLNFVTCGSYGYKENIVSLDGVNIGNTVVEEGKTFVDCIMTGIYMETGKHEIEVSSSWGWVLIDRLEVMAKGVTSVDKGELSTELIDPYASERTKKLMQFLVDINGKYTLSGQYADAGLSSAEFDVIETATGRLPAILGLDLMESSPSRASHGSTSQVYTRAKAFDEAGGIVTLSWHWNAPEEYLYNTDEQPWWKGFYTEGTNIDLAKIMNGEDEAGYQTLMDDIDVIAFQLNRLQELNIPILWRPLHEASGGWFWWGAAGADAYKELWKVLYEKLTYEHGLHNLIWVWNGQDKDWYPGDEYVDIIGEDIYPGYHVYSSQASKYSEAAAYTTANKMIALSENGCLFDPDLAFRDNSLWSWFCTWSGDFVMKNGTLSEEYTEAAMFDKVYNHTRVITLDELPDLKTYGD